MKYILCLLAIAISGCTSAPAPRNINPSAIIQGEDCQRTINTVTGRPEIRCYKNDQFKKNLQN